MIKHNDICITEDPGMGRNEQKEYRNNGKKFPSFDEEQPMAYSYTDLDKS